MKQGPPFSSAHSTRSHNGTEFPGITSITRYGKQLPQKLREQMKARPNAVLAAVGGVSFILGAFFGSKLGRVAMIAALGYGAKRVIEGDLGTEFGKFLETAVKDQLGS
jgi:hypothetical protein